jgi:phosphoglycolate phosphatase
MTGAAPEPTTLVLFDLDGTLADTLSDIAAALRRARSSVGLGDVDDDAIRAAVGHGIRHLVEHTATDAPQLWDALVDRFRSEYRRGLVVDTAPYPGVPELLDALRTRRLPMAILSNKPHDMTQIVVEKLFASWPFSAIFGAREGHAKKPDPSSALEIAGIAGVDPSRCIFVGDTEADMQTAQAAGMIPVGVSWGFRPAPQLRTLGARTVLEQPAQLLELLAPAP